MINPALPPIVKRAKLDSEHWLQIHLTAIDLVTMGKMSLRGAADQINEECGEKVISAQTILRKLKMYDGSPESLADKRGTNNGKTPRFTVEAPAMQMILGHRAAGQGAWSRGREFVMKRRKMFGIPATQIPSMNQIYYAVKNTPKVREPDHERELADLYEGAKTSAYCQKYEPAELLAADEAFFTWKYRSADTNEEITRCTFIAVDAATGIFRRPTTVNKAFDEESFLVALKTACGPAPELGVHLPCIPKVIKIDNASFHKTLSVFESEKALKKALNVDFEIKFSLKRTPKSNARAERHVGLIRQMFTNPFSKWMEIRKKHFRDGYIYAELFDKLLIEFMKEHNSSRRAKGEYTRIQEYNMGAPEERIRFNPSVLDKHFRYYRKGLFGPIGVEIDWENHYDNDHLRDYRDKELILATNPDKMDFSVRAYFKKSERAPLQYIGDLVHAEKDAKLNNRKHKDNHDEFKATSSADNILAAKFVQNRDLELEATIAEIKAKRGERKRATKKDKGALESKPAQRTKKSKASAQPDPEPDPEPTPTGWASAKGGK